MRDENPWEPQNKGNLQPLTDSSLETFPGPGEKVWGQHENLEKASCVVQVQERKVTAPRKALKPHQNPSPTQNESWEGRP